MIDHTSTTLHVTVKAQARRDQVTTIDATHFQVTTTKPAQDNKANLAVIKLLAEHLHLPKSRLLLTHGDTSKYKQIKILPP